MAVMIQFHFLHLHYSIWFQIFYKCRRCRYYYVYEGQDFGYLNYSVGRESLDKLHYTMVWKPNKPRDVNTTGAQNLTVYPSRRVSKFDRLPPASEGWERSCFYACLSLGPGVLQTERGDIPFSRQDEVHSSDRTRRNFLLPPTSEGWRKGVTPRQDRIGSPSPSQDRIRVTPLPPVQTVESPHPSTPKTEQQSKYLVRGGWYVFVVTQEDFLV